MEMRIRRWNFCRKWLPVWENGFGFPLSNDKNTAVWRRSGQRYCSVEQSDLPDLFLCAVLQSLEEGVLIEETLSGEVGDGAGDPEDAVVGAG